MLFVPTRDRATALASALRSHRDALERASSRAVPIVVADDSDDERATRAACEGTGSLHLGRSARARLVAALATCADEREVLARALLPAKDRTTTWAGATRNVIALTAAGSRYVSIDDDSLSVFHRPRALAPPKRVIDPQPIEIGSTADVEPIAVDPLSPHEAFLGRPAAAAAPDAPPHFRIAMTFVGVYGDLGVGEPGQLAFARGDSQQHLAAGLFEQIARGGSAVRLARAVQASLMPFAMMGAYGADATRIMPPFLSAGRNQDGLFALVLRLVDPGACFVHLPLAISHRPSGGRRYDLTKFASFGASPRLSDLVRVAVASAHAGLPDADPAKRMRALGGALDRETSLARLADGWNETRLAWSRQLDESARACPHGPLREGTLQLAGALARPVTLDDRAEGLPVLASIRQFGRSLALWPDVWERARAMNAAGRRAA